MVPRLETLLDAEYKIVIYSGQLDVIIAPALTELFLPRVSWAGQQEYIDADRMVWRVESNDTEVRVCYHRRLFGTMLLSPDALAAEERCTCKPRTFLTVLFGMSVLVHA